MPSQGPTISGPFSVNPEPNLLRGWLGRVIPGSPQTYPVQTGPDFEGFTPLSSGYQAFGSDQGLIYQGPPNLTTVTLGTTTSGFWERGTGYRTVFGVCASGGTLVDPTAYTASGNILDTERIFRIASVETIAGAKVQTSIGPPKLAIEPRLSPTYPRTTYNPQTYRYYAGKAPDNQNYTPSNTPEANTAAEGKTGGGVTHRSYEGGILTNVLGSQGTSDRSQWRYNAPVHCATYTELVRSTAPGLMSTALRYIYRGPSVQYNLNYGAVMNYVRCAEVVENVPCPTIQSFFLIIGSPYYSLGQEDPSLLNDDIEENIIGTQNTFVNPDGTFLVLSGGRLYRTLSGPPAKTPYRELARYDQNLNLISRIRIEGGFTNIYNYSFDSPYQMVRMKDGRILAYIDQRESIVGPGLLPWAPGGDTEYPGTFLICNYDLSNVYTFALYSDPGVGFFPDLIPACMVLGEKTGNIYMSDFNFDSIQLVHSLRVTPGSSANGGMETNWFRTCGSSEWREFRGYLLICAVVNDVEYVISYGFCQFWPGGDFALRQNRGAYITLDVNGDVVPNRAFDYHDSTKTGRNDHPTFEALIQLDNTTFVGSGFTGEPLDIPDSFTGDEDKFICLLDIETGEVIKNVGIGFGPNFEYYGGDFLAHETLGKDEEGNIYYAFAGFVETPVKPSGLDNLSIILIKFNSDLEVLDSALISIPNNRGSLYMSGSIEIKGCLICIPIFQEGPFSDLNDREPVDGSTLFIWKDDFSVGIGKYWKDGVAFNPPPDGTGYEIASLRPYVRTVPHNEMTVTPRTSFSNAFDNVKLDITLGEPNVVSSNVTLSKVSE